MNKIKPFDNNYLNKFENSSQWQDLNKDPNNNYKLKQKEDLEYISKGKLVGMINTKIPWFNNIKSEDDFKVIEQNDELEQYDEVKVDKKELQGYDLIGGALIVGVVILIVFKIYSRQNKN